MRTIAIALFCTSFLWSGGLQAAELPLPPVKPKAKPAPAAPIVRRVETPKPEPRPTGGLVLLVLIGLAAVATGALLTRSRAPRASESPESDETQPRSL